MEKVSDEKTKPDDTDGYLGTILYREFYSSKELFYQLPRRLFKKDTVSEWCERKKEEYIDVLQVLEDYTS